MPILSKNKKIITFIRQTVAESVQGILADQDFGLVVRDNIAKRLDKYSKIKKMPAKTLSLSKIKKKYL